MPDGRVVVVAVGEGRDDLDLAPLSQVDNETRAVAGSYSQGRARVLDGDDATVDRLVAELGRPTDVLHVSAHALLDPDLGPRIVLAPTRPGGDGLLDAAAIASLNPAPRLVVLSACDTGRGELVGGEGVLGLVRALTLAGSSQIVATLWTVDDARSAELMGRFHRNLARGLPPSRALWAGRRSVLEDGFVHPFSWAGFVLYGAD
jgi:CHAT domain-containing protein